MEIQDFKPEQAAEKPDVEDAAAVKEVAEATVGVAVEESVEEEAPVVEDVTVEDEVTVEEEPVPIIEGTSPAELINSLVELKDQFKAAGLRPLQNVVVSYLNQGAAIVNGLTESLEGKKKKDK